MIRPPPYAIWAEGTVYEKGDKTVRAGQVYQAKWWTRGEDPDAPVANDWQTPWRLIGPVLPTDHPAVTTTIPAGTYPDWSEEAIYQAGDRTMVEGVGYEAKWWNQADQPGGPVDETGQTPRKVLEP